MMQCFPNEVAFDAWQTAATASGAPQMLPCIDCTRQYQARMIAAGRCAHPQTQFSDSGKVYGMGMNAQDEMESALLLRAACALLGKDAGAAMAGISASSVRQYTGQLRTLPKRKREQLRCALQAAVLMLMKSYDFL